MSAWGRVKRYIQLHTFTRGEDHWSEADDVLDSLPLDERIRNGL